MGAFRSEKNPWLRAFSSHAHTHTQYTSTVQTHTLSLPGYPNKKVSKGAEGKGGRGGGGGGGRERERGRGPSSSNVACIHERGDGERWEEEGGPRMDGEEADKMSI